MTLHLREDQDTYSKAYRANDSFWWQIRCPVSVTLGPAETEPFYWQLRANGVLSDECNSTRSENRQESRSRVRRGCNQLAESKELFHSGPRTPRATRRRRRLLDASNRKRWWQRDSQDCVISRFYNLEKWPSDGPSLRAARARGSRSNYIPVSRPRPRRDIHGAARTSRMIRRQEKRGRNIMGMIVELLPDAPSWHTTEQLMRLGAQIAQGLKYLGPLSYPSSPDWTFDDEDENALNVTRSMSSFGGENNDYPPIFGQPAFDAEDRDILSAPHEELGEIPTGQRHPGYTKVDQRAQERLQLLIAEVEVWEREQRTLRARIRHRSNRSCLYS